MHHDLIPPVSEAHARALRINDTVTLNGTLFGLRDATQIHLFDRGRKTRLDLRGPCGDPHGTEREAGGAKRGQSRRLRAGLHRHDGPSGSNGTRFTRPLMAELGVRLIIGKGGLRDDSLAAFRELGGAYLAIIGGTAALETTWVERIEDVDLDDLNPESLWQFRVRDFGPLLVAMDSQGGSLYDIVRSDAQARRAKVLQSLGVKP
jgi:L(+)-tartrate dehydratase beta subunit